MAAFEVIALDTATPQLRAPGASDTYTFPRAVEMPLGTANGVLYLNGSKVVTSGSGLTFDGTNFAVGTSSPSAKLDVTGIANSLQARFGSIAGRGLEISTALVSGKTDAGSVLNAKGDAAGTFIFQTDSTEQMRLTSTGLGIGTSSPGAKLEVVPGANNIMQIENASHSTLSGLSVAATFSRGSDGITGLAAVFGWNNGGIAISGREGIVLATGGATSYSGTTERARIPPAGGMIVGTAALATNATDGFLYVAGCAGTPTGTPTAYTGRVPIVVDTTNHKLYFYSGGVWRDAGP